MTPARTTSRPSRPSRPARTAAALAAVLGASGLLHLAVPATYDAVVPRSLPGRPRGWTLASGVAELVVAAALAAPGTRRTGGALAAALYVAVFPANVSMALRALRSDRASTRRRVATVARLPLQVPLVTAALGVRRDS